MHAPHPHNRLLLSMSPADFGLLAPDLEPVTLAVRQVLERPGRRVDAIYFPESGFASVVAVQADDTKVEVGLIGREGMSGLTIVLGNHRSPHSTYIQSPGRAQRIGSAKFRKAIEASPCARFGPNRRVVESPGPSLSTRRVGALSLRQRRPGAIKEIWIFGLGGLGAHLVRIPAEEIRDHLG
jgi:hypothetical protein